mgnify:CR=1 FL=1
MKDYRDEEWEGTMRDDFRERLLASILEVDRDLAELTEKRTGLGLEYLNLRVTYLEDRKITEAKVKEATAEIAALRKQRRQLLAAARALGIEVGGGVGVADGSAPNGGSHDD